MTMHLHMDSMGSFLVWLGRASWQASALIALVFLAQWLFRRQLAPRWRHALWLLVMLRLALPWAPESRVSLFNWFQSPVSLSSVSTADTMTPAAAAEDELYFNPAVAPSIFSRPFTWQVWLAGLWLTGVVLLIGKLLVVSRRLGTGIRRQRPVTNPTLLNLLEDCKQEVGVHTPLTLIETSAVGSPSLHGFVRPRLLLPARFAQNFSTAELRYVFLHELGHVKRGDILLNWLNTGLLILHWFNPLVWFAFSRMQGDRELACDALVLAHTRDAENQSYGQTIIKLLETFCRPTRSPGMVGILENKNQMKRRISMIAKFKKTNRWPLVAMAVFAGLAIVTLTNAQSPTSPATSDASKAGTADEQGPPQIIATSPRVGETDVDPALAEITVTFDRDMGKGSSWTGGGPDYPPSPEGKRAIWRDKRTCVLPVKLEAGHYYRVGINSQSFQNFSSAKGVPARPSAIYFTTTGASQDLKRKTAKPQIVGLNPKNGTMNVDPKLTEIRVTFNVAMGEGFSWTGGGSDFPKTPEGKKAFWMDDHTTCVMPVALEPGKTYRMGLNSPSHKNFQSAGGVPLDPVTITFKTRDN
jgi:beta-lactamase regulating signal transducer with metallopeptidase domain